MDIENVYMHVYDCSNNMVEVRTKRLFFSNNYFGDKTYYYTNNETNENYAFDSSSLDVVNVYGTSYYMYSRNIYGRNDFLNKIKQKMNADIIDMMKRFDALERVMEDGKE